MCDLSLEDKATLFYLLTSPSSNIIGVYQVVFRVAAAEMGWTTEQLLVVLNRLEEKDLINFTETGWVWVKIWWKHNSAKGAFSPKLKENAKRQMVDMPEDWRETFVDSVLREGVNRVSIGYPYPIDTLGPNSSININSSANGLAQLRDWDESRRKEM
jgi:hypothetical protein